jgi:hypothetical protein
MGHKLGDIDSFGASVGIYRIATALNKKAHIVKWTISIAASIILILSVSLLLYYYISGKENKPQQPIVSNTGKTIFRSYQ